jgi:protein-disulfide isomerase
MAVELFDLARAGLAALLLTAVLLKIAAPGDPAAAAVRLGVPRSWIAGSRGRAVGSLLVSVESVLALGLLAPSTARAAAGATAVVLLGSGVLLARAVAGGERGECGCFGASAGRLGWPAVARNAVAALVATLVAVLGGTIAGAGTNSSAGRSIPALVVGCLAALAGTLTAFVVLAADNSRLRRRTLSAAGAAAAHAHWPSSLDPGVTVRLADGTTRTLGSLLGGRAALLVFADPSCAPCTTVLAHLVARPRALGRPIIVVSRGTLEANERIARDLQGIPVLIQDDFELANALGVRGTPAALELSGTGSSIGTQVTGAAAVMELIAQLPYPVAGGHQSAPVG